MIALTMMLAAAAQAPGAAAPRTAIMPEGGANRALFERWGLSDAVIDGDRVYLSGIVAGLRTGETDQKVAFERAFTMIGEVLKRSGSSWDEVVDMTTYHTDWPAQMDDFIAVKHRFVKAPFPAWTAIDIDRLVPPNGLVEIKVVARRREP